MEGRSPDLVAKLRKNQLMDGTPRMPADVIALLRDIAKIRHTILENAPQCLPLLAPAVIDAEQRIYAIWSR